MTRVYGIALVARAIAGWASVAILCTVALPAQAGVGPMVPIVWVGTTVVPSYNTNTCPPELLQVTATFVTAINGILSTTFYSSVGVRGQLTSPSGLQQTVPSDRPYNVFPVAGQSSTAVVTATDTSRARGRYQGVGAHVTVRTNGESRVLSSSGQHIE